LAKRLKLNDKGLIPAIVQDDDTGEVLMLGYMNKESLELTLSSGEVWFYSRSRQELWHKGATSGNRLIVRELWLDCDGDTILVKAHPLGPVCHTGERTCFFQRLTREDIKDNPQEEAC
jgi:phosphoribosyl-AMP cyclohydrolase